MVGGFQVGGHRGGLYEFGGLAEWKGPTPSMQLPVLDGHREAIEVSQTSALLFFHHGLFSLSLALFPSCFLSLFLSFYPSVSSSCFLMEKATVALGTARETKIISVSQTSITKKMATNVDPNLILKI